MQIPGAELQCRAQVSIAPRRRAVFSTHHGHLRTSNPTLLVRGVAVGFSCADINRHVACHGAAYDDSPYDSQHDLLWPYDSQHDLLCDSTRYSPCDLDPDLPADSLCYQGTIDNIEDTCHTPWTSPHLPCTGTLPGPWPPPPPLPLLPAVRIPLPAHHGAKKGHKCRLA